MKRFTTAAGLGLALATASPSHALETCKSITRLNAEGGTYVITHELIKTKTKLLRHTHTYVPEMGFFISDTNLRAHYNHSMFLDEEQEREWTLVNTPQGQRYQAGTPTYRFHYVFNVTRPDKDTLPKWAKRVDDKSLARCSYHKDGQKEVVKSNARFGLKCTLTVDEKTRPKLSGMTYVEVRGTNLKGTEIVRAQYTIHYPQSVKDETLALGQAMDAKFANGQCAPIKR